MFFGVNKASILNMLKKYDNYQLVFRLLIIGNYPFFNRSSLNVCDDLSRFKKQKRGHCIMLPSFWNNL